MDDSGVFSLFVRKNGTVYIEGDEKAIGVHCINYNAVSIGICAEENFNVEAVGEVQHNALLELAHSILSKY